MICIDLTGGLGNQLFEYAFIYNQHKKLNTRFFLIKSGAPIEIYKYFELEKNLFYYIDRIFFNHEGFKLFFSHYLRGLFYNAICKYFINGDIKAGNADDPEKTLIEKDKIYYHGYFQSEIYFRENASAVIKAFTLKKKHTNLYWKRFGWLSSKKTVVTVHIRLSDFKTAFDYLELGSNDLSLPFHYFHKLIKELHQVNNFYVFISDDIEALKSEFSYLENKYFSKEDSITDFQLMMNADVCVIANSTFSWWAAYLNSKANKIVYCPRHFLGFLKGEDYPNKIYPDNWIKVSVTQ